MLIWSMFGIMVVNVDVNERNVVRCCECRQVRNIYLKKARHAFSEQQTIV